ncbi:hypothetical protein GCM10028822_40880 [Hymenobacter terrigena]
MPTNPPIRILLVEDEPLFARLLLTLVRGLGYVPVGPVASAEEALDLYRELPRPDLALLDINLSGDLDGVDLARELQARQPLPIIFVTSLADREHFARARALSPAAYLLKPFDQTALEHAIELALHNFAKGLAAVETTNPAAGEALLNWGHDLVVRECIFLRERGRLTKVCIDDIHYVEAGEKYCVLMTAHGKFAVRMSLRELALELPATRFAQSQRGYLVNADHIDYIEPATNTLSVAGTVLPLGRSYREALLSQFRLVG